MLYYANNKEVVSNDNDSKPAWPQNTGLPSGRGHSHVLRADEVLFSLGWQSSKDGTSIKTPVVV